MSRSRGSCDAYDEVVTVVCPISHDPRSTLRGKPLTWTTLASCVVITATSFGEEAGFVGLSTEPAFAFRQRGLLVPGAVRT